MGSLERRLSRLEDQGARAPLPGSDKEGQERRREQFAALHRGIERHRRAQAGEDTGPAPEVSIQDERRVIDHVIPRYRFSEGWQSQEAREFLDEWERRARERIERRSQ